MAVNRTQLDKRVQFFFLLWQDLNLHILDDQSRNSPPMETQTSKGLATTGLEPASPVKPWWESSPHLWPSRWPAPSLGPHSQGHYHCATQPVEISALSSETSLLCIATRVAFGYLHGKHWNIKTWFIFLGKNVQIDCWLKHIIVVNRKLFP